MQEPPEDPACVNTDPAYFEEPYLYERGLQVCNTCQVHLWCLNRVDPARSHFDGVAGGQAWKDGRLVAKHFNTNNLVPVEIYMDTAKPRTTEEEDKDQNGTTR